MKNKLISLGIIITLCINMTACEVQNLGQTDNIQTAEIVENSDNSNKYMEESVEDTTDSNKPEKEASASTNLGLNNINSDSDNINPNTDEEVTQEAAEEQPEIPILKTAVMNKMGCRIGAAAAGKELDDKKVWKIVTTHFNALTLGNELKPDALFGYSNGKVPGVEEAELNGETIIVPKLDYSRAEKMLDKVLEWNQTNPDNKIWMRGHVLVWHSQTPEWFFHVDYDKNKPYETKETMNKRLEWYIRTVLTHFTGEDSKYKDIFYGWDVVNEAISDNPARVYRTDEENPNEPLSNDTHGNNSSWWHVYGSNEFIINAFIYANKYAPADLELYYNDYNECGHQKAKGILELLNVVKEKEGAQGTGTRLSGFGMQGHYDMTGPSVLDIESYLEQYSEAAGSVQITELDLKASADYDGSKESREKEFAKEATRYKSIYWAINKAAENGANITGITFWGTVDHYSWLQFFNNVGGGAGGRQKQCPLLFDDKYEPKPAFYVFTEG